MRFDWVESGRDLTKDPIRAVVVGGLDVELAAEGHTAVAHLALHGVVETRRRQRPTQRRVGRRVRRRPARRTRRRRRHRLFLGGARRRR